MVVWLWLRKTWLAFFWGSWALFSKKKVEDVDGRFSFTKQHLRSISSWKRFKKNLLGGLEYVSLGNGMLLIFLLRCFQNEYTMQYQPLLKPLFLHVWDINKLLSKLETHCNWCHSHIICYKHSISLSQHPPIPLLMNYWLGVRPLEDTAVEVVGVVKHSCLRI